MGNHSKSRIPCNNTAMAPSYDLGSPCPTCPAGTWWIHCRNKTEVSRRLALQLNQLFMVRKNVVFTKYNKFNSEFSGPIVIKTVMITNYSDSHNIEYHVLEKPKVMLTMGHADGLFIGPAQGCVQCCEQPQIMELNPKYKYQQLLINNGHLFEVSNRKGIWFPAVGAILMTKKSPPTVIVTPVSNVTGPWISAVRFAVQDIPQCALYNSAQLPAVPFSLPVPWNDDKFMSERNIDHQYVHRVKI